MPMEVIARLWLIDGPMARNKAETGLFKLMLLCLAHIFFFALLFDFNAYIDFSYSTMDRDLNAAVNIRTQNQ